MKKLKRSTAAQGALVIELNGGYASPTVPAPISNKC
jgi:hypothetical protein